MTEATHTRDLSAELAASEATLDLMRESFADLRRIMDRDESGWAPYGIGILGDDLRGFDATFRRRAALRNLIASMADPLIKRGLNLRAAYIWGGGVTIAVRDEPGTGQDINAVVQSFLDDHDNLGTFVDTTARIELERSLGIVGEVALCLPTDPVSGRVRVRVLPPEQITRIAKDPEDAASEQLYLREWADSSGQPVKAWYPALGYRPSQRDRYRDEVEIRWDHPIKLVRVNRVGDRGVGDVFAAVPWAAAYKRFLEAWSQLTASLSRFAYQVRTRGDRVADAAAKLARANAEAGQNITTDPNTYLEAVGKSGATIDSESGRPLAAMVAAALDLPVTTLLGDPGVTGARATAESVTDASWPVFDVRQQMWGSVLRDVCSWVIDSAVISPAGPLRGTIARDGDRMYAVLPDGDGRTIEVVWPERDDTGTLDRIKAIQLADQMERIPPLTIAKMILDALDVKDSDEVLDIITDDQGNFVPLDVIDARVRQRLGDQGEQA